MRAACSTPEAPHSPGPGPWRRRCAPQLHTLPLSCTPQSARGRPERANAPCERNAARCAAPAQNRAGRHRPAHDRTSSSRTRDAEIASSAPRSPLAPRQPLVIRARESAYAQARGAHDVAIATSIHAPPRHAARPLLRGPRCASRNASSSRIASLVGQVHASTANRPARRGLPSSAPTLVLDAAWLQLRRLVRPCEPRECTFQPPSPASRTNAPESPKHHFVHTRTRAYLHSVSEVVHTRMRANLHPVSEVVPAPRAFLPLVRADAPPDAPLLGTTALQPSPRDLRPRMWSPTPDAETRSTHRPRAPTDADVVDFLGTKTFALTAASQDMPTLERERAIQTPHRPSPQPAVPVPAAKRAKSPHRSRPLQEQELVCTDRALSCSRLDRRVL